MTDPVQHGLSHIADDYTLAAVSRLMKRDRVPWREFLRRCVHAYELLYNPLE